jgi:pimeloyl-ACP methyl ester carboxylesterase
MNRQLEMEKRGRRSAGDARERLLGAAGGSVVGMNLTPELLEFERERLALFARNGFEGQSRWVTDRDGRSTYVIGRGEGPCPAVLVHGGLSQASEWSSLAGRIPGYVIVPDRPGSGLSYQIDYRGVDYRKAAADWLLDLVDGIGADQVDLVGNSMGGFFATAFAIAHPDRVRRLVLVGAAAGVHEELPLFVRLWGNPITGPLIRRLKITDPETLRTRVFSRLLVAQAETVPRDDLEIMVAAGAIPGTDRTAYTMLRAVTTLRGWRPRLMLRDDMAHLPVPTLFLWGDADAFAPPSRGQDMAARMPDARCEVVAGAGHLPHFDRLDTVAAAIVEFLAPDRPTSGHLDER